MSVLEPSYCDTLETWFVGPQLQVKTVCPDSFYLGTLVGIWFDYAIQEKSICNPVAQTV